MKTNNFQTLKVFFFFQVISTVFGKMEGIYQVIILDALMHAILRIWAHRSFWFSKCVLDDWVVFDCWGLFATSSHSAALQLNHCSVINTVVVRFNVLLDLWVQRSVEGAACLLTVRLLTAQYNAAGSDPWWYFNNVDCWMIFADMGLRSLC